MSYYYDASGSPIGMQYRLSTYAEDAWDVYCYEKNLLGDVVGIYNSTGTRIATYSYNSYGLFIASPHTTEGQSIVAKNPLRYRGYYFDNDLDLYYLQSRYYDYRICRFISPDAVEYLGANGDLMSYNLYSYCSNNPVVNIDPTGEYVNLLIGAGFGALVGLAVYAIPELLKDFDNVKTPKFWLHAGVSTVAGAISGGLAASGVLVRGQMVGNAIIGALSNIADFLIDGEKSIDKYILGAIDGALMGALAGCIGGNGSASKHVSNSFWRMMSSQKDDLTYYFSQILKQATADGKKAILPILESAIPSEIKAFFSLME